MHALHSSKGLIEKNAVDISTCKPSFWARRNPATAKI
jgi:hypothetical protein